jgi:L-seryl-tRNA(Ser) seleniumtransferase
METSTNDNRGVSPADPRRALPSIDQLLQDPAVRALEARFGRARVGAEARFLVADARRRVAAGDPSAADAVLADAPRALAARLERAAAPSLVRVINATGVVVHTNLGRAPLPADTAARVAEIAAGYSNLEMDLATGARGEREVHAETRLKGILGADATVVVNNNAAAVLLAVNTFAEGREVVVSRGELVEIGGSFRIPEVLRKSGAALREVGTTNRTRASDYRAAIGPATGMILKVHPSNFRIVGFVESPSREELAAVAADAKVPLVEDLGSGLLEALPPPLDREELASASLRAGVDVVTFSGDKLLGGPQAGIAAGREAPLRAMRTNPLYRALRVDKMTLAALDGILREYEEGRGAGLPVPRMLRLSADDVRRRADAMRERLERSAPRLSAEVAAGSSAVGGGAAPAVEVPTALLVLRHPDLRPDEMARRLRAGDPGVAARVADDALVVDLRTVSPEEEDALLAALAGLTA